MKLILFFGRFLSVLLILHASTATISAQTEVFYAVPTELVFPDVAVQYPINPASGGTIVLAAKGESEPIQLVVKAGAFDRNGCL